MIECLKSVLLPGYMHTMNYHKGICYRYGGFITLESSWKVKWEKWCSTY